MNRFWKNPVFRKFIFSYLALLIVPVLFFSFFVINFCNQYVVGRLLHEQQLMVDSSIASVEATLQRYRTIINDIQNEKVFFHEFSDDMPVAFIDIRYALRDAEVMLNMSVDVLYCDLKKQEFHTAQGMRRSYPYYETVLGKCRAANDTEMVILDGKVNTVVPLETGSQGIQTALVLSMPQKHIEDSLFFSEMYPDTSTQLYIGKTLVYQSPAARPKSESDYYHISSASKLNAQVEIHSYIPKKSIFGALYPTFCQATLLILAVVFFCGLIIYFVFKGNYIPLYKILVNFVYEMAPGVDTDNLSDMEAVASRRLLQQKQLAESNSALRRDYLLHRLLYASRKEEISPADYGGLLSGPEYLCIVSGTPFRPPENLQSQTLMVAPKLYCTVCSGAGSLLQRYAAETAKRLEDAAGSQAPVGIGSVVTGLAEVHESFLHSRAAYNEAVSQHIPVSCYSREPAPDRMDYPFGLIDDLADACRRLDLPKFTELSEMAGECIRKAPTRHFASCVFSDYLQTVSRSLAVLAPDSFNYQEFCSGFYGKPGYSRELLQDYLASVMHEASRLMQQALSAKRPPLSADAICSYLDQRCLAPDFSLKSMSMDLGTSQSTLSHLFKKEKGITLSEYIDLYKIDRAKEALAQPGASVNEISQQLGFANASTFIRKFKKFEGITPGEYRDRLTP